MLQPLGLTEWQVGEAGAFLGHPSRPALYEPYVTDAGDYVALAEAVNGASPRAVSAPYVWGELMTELDRRATDVRLVNLETSITRSDEYWPSVHLSLPLQLN